jgi:cellulose synthase/poly-beta-1,6-N-acetylglucosamine synthase-like glycosyltransferase
LDLSNLFSLLVAICWLVLIYVWAGYPLILMGLTRARPFRDPLWENNQTEQSVWTKTLSGNCGVSRGNGNDSRLTSAGKDPNFKLAFLPAVAILLSAHNEEKHIGARIKNLLELEYPENKITVRIGVDGSSDRTADIARQWASKHLDIRIYEVPERRGKIATLKDLISGSKEDILILTDANTVFKTDALQKLVSHFVDPCIACVCGRLQLLGEGEEKVYWRMETHLKMMESSLDSCLGANGAIYAIRRDLFWKDIPDNTIVDDFVIAMKVREQGLRVVYEHEAVGQEYLPSLTDEWGRRKRIGAGDYQALSLCKKSLLPKYGKFAWMFWSHKVLRWFTPHIFLLLFIFSFTSLYISLLRESLCFLTPALLSAILLCALTGRFLRNTQSAKKTFLSPLRLCDHFFTMQTALFLGFFRFCRGNLRGYWERTSRD